jgi:RecA/RadA recombinase
MSLRDRLIKNSVIEETSALSESKLFEKKDVIPLDCVAMNVALSGDALEGGLTPGLIQIAAESQHFKSKFALEFAKAFIAKYPEGVVIFYDSEYGTPESYFDDIPMENIIHTPVLDLEQFKFDIVKQLKEITKEDKVLIIVDSIGNIPSIKELDDAEAKKSTADMSRAKQMKSVFRMMMPSINQKNIYCVMVNHVYKTQDMYPTDVPTGGTGSIYNSNIIWTISKAKEKESITFEVDGKKKAKEELVGYKFTINAFKSRFIKTESKIPIYVTFEGGIEKWSGMLDMAISAGYIIKPTAQKYARRDKPNETFKAKEIENDDDFWNALFAETDFNEWIKKEYQY